MQTIPVYRTISLVIWFDRSLRLWTAHYIDQLTGDQVGPAWYDSDRDSALVHRPEIPGA